MPRNGSGTYSLPQAAFANGTVADATAVNSDFTDIGSALTFSIAKDGQTTPTANLPMGNFKLTGLGAGSSAGDSIAVGQSTSVAVAGDFGAANFVVGGQTTTTVGLVGFDNGNGPALKFYGTAGTVPGGMLGVLASGTQSFRVDSAGNFLIGNALPQYQSTVYGAGQTTASFTDAGSKGSALLLQDSGASTGNGGALAFAAGNTNNTPFAVIKGTLLDATTNSVGDLNFATRSLVTDTNMTDRWMLKGQTGDFVPVATNAYNIGLSGNRPATVYGVLGNFSGAVTMSDASTLASGSVGFRGLPAASVTTGAFAASDAGKTINATGGVTVPNSTMTAGDVVTVDNQSGSAITITASITTLTLAGTTTTGNRTLAANGLCTIKFRSSTSALISGVGLS